MVAHEKSVAALVTIHSFWYEKKGSLAARLTRFRRILEEIISGKKGSGGGSSPTLEPCKEGRDQVAVFFVLAYGLAGTTTLLLIL